MELEVIPSDSRVQLRLDMGTDDNGRRIVRTRTFNRVKSTVLDEDVFEIAQGIASLQQNDVISVIRVNQAELISV